MQNSVTHLSILARLREGGRDPTAWRTFVDRYGSRIYQWCLTRKLQPADAEDVTQEVLVKLAKHLGTFEYNPGPTFRGCLRRVTENAVKDFVRHKRSSGHDFAGEGTSSLEDVSAREDLVARLEEAYDLELFDLAKASVRARVDTHRWRAWEMIALDQASGETVGRLLDMKIPTVYSCRFQVQKMIAEEVRLIESQANTQTAQRQ